MSHLLRRIAPVLPLLPLLAAPLAAKPRWVPLGPSGGSVERLAVAPSDSLVVYALTSEKVLFKSTDGGASWQPLRMFYDRSARYGWFVNDIAVDPARHGTIYLPAEGRLWKSVDGGASWAEVGPRTASSVYAVSVDPAWASRVYAGGAGVWVSTNRGASWKPARSSIGYVDRIIAVKQPVGTVYAAGGSGIYKSADAGLTWRALGLPSGSTRVGVFAVAPSDSRRLYASIDDTVSDGPDSSVVSGLFRSTDGGRTWQRTGRQPAANDEILSLAVSPRSPRTLWLATQRRGLFRSSDGGDTWTASGLHPSSRVAVVTVAPSSPRTVYAGLTPWGTDAGGVFASTDTGRTWARRNRGLFGVQVTAPALDPSDPEALWVGHQGGLYHSTNAGADWERMALPPARGVAVDPLAPSTVYALCGSSLWRTLDGGAAWTYLHASGLPAEGLSLLRIAPNDSSKLGGLGRALWDLGVWIFMSTDAGEHWRHPEHPSAQCGLFDLAFAPSAPSTLYVAGSVAGSLDSYESCWGGAFFRSTDGGATWSDLSSGGFPFNIAWRIAVDPVDPRLVYLASLSKGFGAECNGVLKSTDGGSTWARAGGLTDCITSVAASPIAGVVWASTEEGRVFRSGNGGITWRERTPGLLAHQVYELVIDPKVPVRVYAATSGGLWVWKDETR